MAYQSLYRRYRSQTFAEVLGQEHVTGALRNAVREGRVGHGYLFSGPRGTGKTSTARILAKVLNCANPADGEPCTTCDNCTAVAEGRSVDWMHELDAASNNGVEAMRDLLGRVSMGTSGNRKVYILDEVHMLSKGASNTLLKTLEEPPEHVVFVLATTEPEKVLPTIRSRTQHFDFKLLTADTLAAHVRHVIADAQLDLDDDVVEYVVRSGGGSARDTLSALDQVAAAGGIDDEAEPIDDLVAALAARDAGAALVAVDTLVRAGQHPRTLADALIATLRDAFLVAMGAPRGGLTDLAEQAARETAQAIGPAALTAAMEGIGTAIVEMRHAPDPRIPLEVALVRLTRPDVGGDLEARVAALEAAVAHGSAPAAPPSTGPSRDASPPEPAASPEPPTSGAAAPPSGRLRGAEAARARLAGGGAPGPAPDDAPRREAPAAGSRPSLGGVRRNQGAATPPTEPTPTPTPAPAPPAPDPAEAAPAASAAPPSPDPAPPPTPTSTPTEAPAPAAMTLEAVDAVWPDVLASMRGRAKALYKAATVVAVDGTTVTMSVPTDTHREHCLQKQDEVATALSGRLGSAVRLDLTVAGNEPAPDGPGGTEPGGAGSSSPSSPADADDEFVDLDTLTDAPDPGMGGVQFITDAFPGAEIEEP